MKDSDVAVPARPVKPYDEKLAAKVLQNAFIVFLCDFYLIKH
jgi:hypothetical protein